MKKTISTVMMLAIIVALLPAVPAKAALPQSAIRDYQVHSWTAASTNTLELIPHEDEVTFFEPSNTSANYTLRIWTSYYDINKLVTSIKANLLLFDNGDLYLSTAEIPDENSFIKIMSNVKSIGSMTVPYYKTSYVVDGTESQYINTHMYMGYKERYRAETTRTIRITTVLDDKGGLYILGSPNDIPDTNKALTGYCDNGAYRASSDAYAAGYNKIGMHYKTSLDIEMLYPFGLQSDPDTAVKVANDIKQIVPGYKFEYNYYRGASSYSVSGSIGTRAGFYIDGLGNKYFGFPTTGSTNTLAGDNILDYNLSDYSYLEDASIYRDNKKIASDVVAFSSSTYLVKGGTLYNYSGGIIGTQVKAVSGCGYYYIAYDDSLWAVDWYNNYNNIKVMEDVACVFEDGYAIRKNGDLYELVRSVDTVLPRKLLAGNGIAPKPVPALHEGNVFRNASNWALVDLRVAANAGLTLAVKDMNYNELITREKFAEIAVALCEKLMSKPLTVSATNPFTDTDNPEILKAYAAGIINGTTSTTFSPNNNITREAIATILMRVVDYAGLKLPQGTEKDFSDANQISSWASAAVKAMTAAGVINGISSDRFAPLNNAKIEEAVILANRIYLLYM